MTGIQTAPPPPPTPTRDMAVLLCGIDIHLSRARDLLDELAGYYLPESGNQPATSQSESPSNLKEWKQSCS